MRWQDVGEKGGGAGIAFLVATATTLGRPVARLFLPFVAAWFLVFQRGIRRASLDYLARVLPGPVGPRDAFRHILTFARVALDRLFFARGDFAPFRLSATGEEHILSAARSGRGAILLLAHVGSYEAMRGYSTLQEVRVSAIGDFRNSRVFAEALRRINPRVDADLIQVEDSPTFLFQVEQRVSSGGIVAIMGDRVGSDARAVEVSFLGGTASFPSGPYLLAAILGCPIYLAFAIYREPNHYDISCELFTERVELPRGDRSGSLARYVQEYASRLEQRCRRAPFNWFNFYDFWSAAP
ncbi:MAG: hypothetical protein WB493_16840 [Anaeromyxobacteraceae bacterium]